MATVERLVHASPAEVFAVLSNGWTYSNWVVGTSHMRAVESTWPARGSKLFHASGIWPITLDDETEVDAVDTNQRLELTVRARPLGEVKVAMVLTKEGSATKVSMHEEPVRGPGKWLHSPASEALLARRNTESLMRLAAIVEQHDYPQK